MDLLEKYRIPLFDAETGTGTAPPSAPPAAVVAAAEPPPVEPSPAPPAPELPAGVHKTPPSSLLVNELTGLRAERRRQDEEIARLRREAAEARALAERATAGTNNQPPAPAAPRIEPPATAEAEIDRRAEYKLFLRDVEGVRERGNRQFGPAFNETVRALAAVGADNDQFVSQVMAADPANAHVVLNALAQDLEGTVALVNMDPNRRMAELTRRAMAASASVTDPAKTAPPAAPPVPPKTISKAPPPPPPVIASTTKTVDWRSDEASDAEFDRGFNEEFLRRRALRR